MSATGRILEATVHGLGGKQAASQRLREHILVHRSSMITHRGGLVAVVGLESRNTTTEYRRHLPSDALRIGTEKHDTDGLFSVDR